MKKITVLSLSIFMCIAFTGFINVQEKIAPSAALQTVMDGAREKAPKTRDERLIIIKELALAQLPLVQTEGLADDEQMKLADLLNFAGKVEEASTAWEKLARSESPLASAACKKLMENAANTKDFATLAAMIQSHRARFPISAEDSSGLFSQVMQLAEHYAQAGEFGKAAQVLLDEVNSLNLDYPYSSFQVLCYTEDIFSKAGKKAEYLELLGEFKQKFAELAAARAYKIPADPEEQKKFNRVTDDWNRLVRAYDYAILRSKLIGTEAPDFELAHFFNSEPVTLKDLRGKVVMVDFWANWCGPCKAAFPAMAELYSEYRDKGFVILGVTGFQGYFVDGDVREGTEKRDLPQERELELITEFIARHNMTWPVAFSSRGSYDPQYGVQGIPTFAVIDRKGIIRLLQVGSGPESEAKLKALIPQLLAEE